MYIYIYIYITGGLKKTCMLKKVKRSTRIVWFGLEFMWWSYLGRKLIIIKVLGENN